MCGANRKVYPMKITIIGGGSGMLSNSIGTVLKKVGYFIQVIGKSSPVAFAPDVFILNSATL